MQLMDVVGGGRGRAAWSGANQGELNPCLIWTTIMTSTGMSEEAFESPFHTPDTSPVQRPLFITGPTKGPNLVPCSAMYR